MTQRDTDASPATAPALPPEYDQALVLMQSGNYRKAIPLLQRLIAKQPGQAGVYLNLGIACRAANRPEEALKALNRSIELSSENPAAYHQKGIVLRQQGDFEGALEAYSKALSLEPDYALVHRSIGILYDLYLRQPAEALDHYRTYRQLTAAPPDSEVSAWIVDLERRSANGQAKAEP